MKNANQYVPKMATITEIRKECTDISTFRLVFKNRKDRVEFKPGQFIQVIIFGAGEVPISISSSPFEKEYMEITVQNAGNVTNALFGLKKGDTVGIRGPYGNWYDMDAMKGKNILMVGGGVGLAPLSSVIEYVIGRRKDFGKVTIFYGTHCPQNVIFLKRVKRWQDNGVDAIFTVSKTYDQKWDGEVGRVQHVFEKFRVDAGIGICCGPPRMLKDVYTEFSRIGIKDENIYFSLERMMQCGIGKCGHCNIGRKYVCMDGPVFRKSEIDGFTEKVWE